MDGLASRRNFSAPPGKLARRQWRTAALKAKELPDPWEGYVSRHKMVLANWCAIIRLLGITLTIFQRRKSPGTCTTLARGNGRQMK